MGLNYGVISLCIYSDGLLQPRDLQLGIPRSQVLSNPCLCCIFRDLLFTVVIHTS